MKRIRLLSIACILLCIVFSFSLVNAATPVTTDLKVHFVDVGQADSILITTKDAAMLIDAGNNGDGTAVVKYIKNQGVKKLDYVVGTHPHEDHIGGLDNVIKAFTIDKVLMPKAQSNTETFEDVLKAIQAKKLKITAPAVGTEYSLGSAKFTILSPSESSYSELNDYSIVIRLQYGNKSFLFCGDAETINEAAMLKSGLTLQSDVIKVGHHGSDSSSSPAFIKAVKAKYAIISVGKDNTYGHPVASTLDTLKNSGATILRTDLSGTIVMTTNGQSITLKTLKSANQATAPPSATIKPTATPKVTATPKPANTEQIVYITNTGSKYHRAGCRYLSKSKIAIELSKAKLSYDPCSVCNPPRY